MVVVIVGDGRGEIGLSWNVGVNAHVVVIEMRRARMHKMTSVKSLTPFSAFSEFPKFSTFFPPFV